MDVTEPVHSKREALFLNFYGKFLFYDLLALAWHSRSMNFLCEHVLTSPNLLYQRGRYEGAASPHRKILRVSDDGKLVPTSFNYPGNALTSYASL